MSSSSSTNVTPLHPTPDNFRETTVEHVHAAELCLWPQQIEHNSVAVPTHFTNFDWAAFDAAFPDLPVLPMTDGCGRLSAQAEMPYFDSCDCLQEFISTVQSYREINAAAHACPQTPCNKYFSHKGDLARHVREVHSTKKFQCPILGCSMLFKRQYRLANHMLSPPKKAEGHPKAKSHVIATRLANSKDVICYFDIHEDEAEQWNVVEYKVPQKYESIFE